MPARREGSKGAVISGWGTALPEKVLTNDELAATMDTSDEWIRTRTGIEERHIGGTTIGLSVESARQALEMSGLDPSRIDALVLATTTPDKQWGTAAAVQDELGLRCGAFDINAACSGFVYGLVNAHGLIAMGAERVLVVGTEDLLLTLRSPLLEPLRSRFLYVHHLRPFTLEDTKNYVHFHLTASGTTDDLLTDGAIQEVFQASRGAPRLINQLVLHAMIGGVLRGVDRLDQEFLKRAVATHPLFSRGDS